MINAPQSVIDALESGNFQFANIVDVNLGDAYGDGKDLVLHLTDFGRSVSFNGITYNHDNAMVEIDGITRKASTGSDKVDVVFSVTDETIVEAIVSRRYINKPTIIRRVLIDSTNQIIGGFAIPVRTAWGLAHSIDGDLEDRVITLSIDSQLGDLNEDNGWYTVSASHNQRYPDDKIMAYSNTVMDEEDQKRYTTDFTGVINAENKPPALSVVYGYKHAKLVPLLRLTHRKSHTGYTHYFTTWIYAINIGDCQEIDLNSMERDGESFKPVIVNHQSADVGGWSCRVRDSSKWNTPILGDLDYRFFFEGMDGGEPNRFAGMYGKGLTLLLVKNRNRDGWVKGAPEIKIPIRGTKVLDPRTGQYSASRNPALQYYDYLRNTQYGAGGRGITVSESSVIALANHFDAIPESAGNEGINSILIDVEVDTAKPLVDNMNIWIEGCRMFTSDYYGEFNIRVEGIAPVTRHYHENDLLEYPEYESGDFTDRINQLTYTVKQLVPDTEDPEQMVEVTVEATFPEDGSDIHKRWLAEDANIPKFESSQLSHVTDLEQAYYWAMVDSRISRQPDELTIAVGATGWLHEAGDVISFTSPILEMDATQWRVVEVSEDDGKVELELKPYDQTFYTPAPDVVPAPIPPAKPPVMDRLEAVNGLNVTVVDGAYQIDWEQIEAPSGYWFQIEVIVSEQDGTDRVVVNEPVIYAPPYRFKSAYAGEFHVSVTKISATDESMTSTLSFLAEKPVKPIVEYISGADWITITPRLLNSSLGTRFRFYKGGEIKAEGYSYTEQGLLPTTTYNYEVSTVNTFGESERQAVAITTTNGQEFPAELPTIPTNLVVTTVTASMSATWSFVAYFGHSHSTIYYQAVGDTAGAPNAAADFSKAKIIATSAAKGVTVGIGDQLSGHVWVTNTNANNIESAPSSPAFAVVKPFFDQGVFDDAIADFEAAKDDLYKQIGDQNYSINGMEKSDILQQENAFWAAEKIYKQKRGLLEAGDAIATGAREIQVLTTTTSALAQEIALLEASVGTEFGQIDASFTQVNQAIADEAGARASAITQLETETAAGLQANTTLIQKVDAKVDGTAASLAGLQTEVNGINGELSQAQIVLESTVNEVGELQSRAFFGVTGTSGGQTTVNGIVVDGKTNSIGFQTNALALLDTAGNKALSWDAASGTFVFKGRLVVGGYAVNSEADIRALDGDTIYEKYQYSVNGTSNWHDTLTTGDLYRRTATVTNGVVGTWSAAAKIAGNDGISITGVVNYYAKSANNALAPTSGWTTTVPTVDATNKYLWNYEEVSYTSGNPTKTPAAVIGTFGEKGIKTVTEYYLATSQGSGVTTSAGGWTTTIQTVTAVNKFLWNYEVTTYTDNSTSSTLPVVIGVYGDKGDKGDDGVSVTGVVNEYAKSSSATVAPSTWSTSVPALDSVNKYLWNRETVSYSSGSPTVTNPAMIGTLSADGVSIQSVTEYYLVSPNSTGVTNASGAWTTTAPLTTPTNKYLWNYELITYSNNSTQKTVAVVIGTHGEKGDAGVSITSVSNEYAKHSSAATAPTTGWSANVPSLDATNKYLWNRETISYSSGSPTVTPAAMIGTLSADGKGVASVTERYLATSAISGVTTATAGWTTTIQTVTASNKYLWNYETVTYTDNSTSVTTPVIIGVYGDKGDKGDQGNAGVSVTGVINYYQKSSSATVAPTTWSTGVPTLDATNKYLWNYEQISYSSGSPTTTAPAMIGTLAADGSNGKGITSITEYYLASASQTGVTTSTSGWTTTPQVTDTTKKYLWNYEVIKYTTGADTVTTPAVIGTHGAIGDKGNDGSAGAGMYGGEFPAIDWTTTTANSRFQSKSGRPPVLNDVFTQTNSTTFETQARQYNGSTWANVAMFVDGSIVAKNTIAGDKIVAGTEITAPKIKGGEIIGGKISLIGTSFMKIEDDSGFGSEGLWYWFGLKKLLGDGSPDLSYATKANAQEWKDIYGNAYFGGSLSAGILKNGAQNTTITLYSTTVTPLEVGPFGTNGKAKTVVISYSCNAWYKQATDPGSVTTPEVLRWKVQRQINGTWTDVAGATGTITGTVFKDYDNEADPSNPYRVTYDCNGTGTFVDGNASTANTSYRVMILAHTRPFTNTIVKRQSLSLISTEQ